MYQPIIAVHLANQTRRRTHTYPMVAYRSISPLSWSTVGDAGATKHAATPWRFSGDTNRRSNQLWGGRTTQRHRDDLSGIAQPSPEFVGVQRERKRHEKTTFVGRVGHWGQAMSGPHIPIPPKTCGRLVCAKTFVRLLFFCFLLETGHDLWGATPT